MEKIEEIRIAEYLLRASPETVYEWLKAWPQRTTEFSFYFGNRIPEEIEQKLLVRNNEIVDLALSSWGTNDQTIETLYQRWCARSVVTDWPPKPSTYPYALIAAILANVNTLGIPTEDFDWLIEHGDDDLFRLMHYNIGLGFRLLRQCAEKDGAYGRIDDNRWLFALAALGYNKGLHRVNTTDNDGPDLNHSDIHKAFVQAATISPKTSSAASVLGQLFINLPSAATDGAYVRNEALAAAVQAWNVEIIDDEKSEYSSLKTYHEYDALTPSERVQFHLLRHYCLYLDLDPDDPVRVRRLAAYSINPVNGGKGWGTGYQNELQKHTGKGLDIESFQRYSERDGPAFMYANSFNGNIWGNKEVSKFNQYRVDPETRLMVEPARFPYPEDRLWIYFNQEKCIADAAAKELLKANDSSEKSDSMEAETLTNIGKVREELLQYHRILEVQIGNLKKWLIWGGVIVVVLLLFRY